MAEYRCGECGWTATASRVEGILAASRHHEREGCQQITGADARDAEHTADVRGWIIVDQNTDRIDWDGELHPTRKAAEASVSEAWVNDDDAGTWSDLYDVLPVLNRLPAPARPADVVETVSELEALPVGSVIREADTGPFLGIETVPGVFEKFPGGLGWHCVAGHGDRTDEIAFPARVLWRPEGGE